MINSLKHVLNNINKNKKLIRFSSVISAVLAGVVFFSIAITNKNVAFAYEVKCHGETIGYVTDEVVVSEASKIINDKISGTAEVATEAVVDTMILVDSNEISNADDLSQKIIESTGELVDGYGLYVDDEFVIAAKSEEEIENALITVKNNVKKITKSDSVDFADDVKVKEGHFCPSLVVSGKNAAQKLNDFANGLKVAVTSKSTKTIEYDTVIKKDSSEYVGTEKTVTKGKDGKVEVIVVTEYVNGKVIGENVVNTNVIEAVVDEKIVKGTKAVPVKTTKATSLPKSYKYVYPVVKGLAGTYVSQYYGGGHTGIDIAAYQGRAIFAVNGGKVVEVTYSNRSYGNTVVIDCGNGIKMKYAHCYTLDVSKGDTVEMGQKIATVGSTGNSTGPHLHFEVIKNGNKINPSSYIGI